MQGACPAMAGRAAAIANEMNSCSFMIIGDIIIGDICPGWGRWVKMLGNIIGAKVCRDGWHCNLCMVDKG